MMQVPSLRGASCNKTRYNSIKPLAEGQNSIFRNFYRPIPGGGYLYHITARRVGGRGRKI
nr:MAG TPA: hypothetical protein [Caudoviricetes sp.]